MFLEPGPRRDAWANLADRVLTSRPNLHRASPLASNPERPWGNESWYLTGDEGGRRLWVVITPPHYTVNPNHSRFLYAGVLTITATIRPAPEGPTTSLAVPWFWLGPDGVVDQAEMSWPGGPLDQAYWTGVEFYPPHPKPVHFPPLASKTLAASSSSSMTTLLRSAPAMEDFAFWERFPPRKMPLQSLDWPVPTLGGVGPLVRLSMFLDEVPALPPNITIAVDKFVSLVPALERAIGGESDPNHPVLETPSGERQDFSATPPAAHPGESQMEPCMTCPQCNSPEPVDALLGPRRGVANLLSRRCRAPVFAQSKEPVHHWL